MRNLLHEPPRCTLDTHFSCARSLWMRLLKNFRILVWCNSSLNRPICPCSASSLSYIIHTHREPCEAKALLHRVMFEVSKYGPHMCARESRECLKSKNPMILLETERSMRVEPPALGHGVISLSSNHVPSKPMKSTHHSSFFDLETPMRLMHPWYADIIVVLLVCLL